MDYCLQIIQLSMQSQSTNEMFILFCLAVGIEPKDTKYVSIVRFNSHGSLTFPIDD